MVNLFGATGYIGSRYYELFPSVSQPRDDLVPRTPKILYMISTTHNHHMPGNPYVDIDTNLTMLMRVLENARRMPDVEFNFISSWFVYGAVSGPAAENMRCDPQGFYSITKRTAEQLLMEYCRHHGMAWRILRLSNVIGGTDARAGAHKNILQRMTRDLREHQHITLINNGEFFRDYLHRDDVCDAINVVMHRGLTNSIYNIGQGHSIKFREAIDYVRQHTQSRSVIRSKSSDDVTDCVLDCGRLQALGWRPRYTWQRAVADVIQHC